MPLRNLVPLTHRPKGLSDTLDGTNAFPGAMSSLMNLVPAPGTASVFVPRCASLLVTDFTGSGITSPGAPTSTFVIGTRCYGMIGGPAGKDYPFCYDLARMAFIPIAGVTTANLPNTPLATGDWIPPTIAAPTNSRIIFTHPGFTGGGGNYFGWLDISNASITFLSGNTTTGSPIIMSINDGGSSSPIIDGVQPGQTISGPGIPAGATVVSASNGGFTLDTQGVTDGSATLTNVVATFGVLPGMGVTGPLIATGSTVVSVSGVAPNYTVVLSLPTSGPTPPARPPPSTSRAAARSPYPRRPRPPRTAWR